MTNSAQWGQVGQNKHTMFQNTTYSNKGCFQEGHGKAQNRRGFGLALGLYSELTTLFTIVKHDLTYGPYATGELKTITIHEPL